MSPSTDLVSQIHGVVIQAKSAGVRAPGRPTLARMTGATEHQVRRALAELANQQRDLEPSENLVDKGVADVDIPDHQVAEVTPVTSPAEVNVGEPHQGRLIRPAHWC